jgi:hypothetical protein
VLLLALLYVAAVAAACALVPLGTRAAGGLLVALAMWQLRFDVARRGLRRPGLPRFAALGVLAGTIWLVVAGALLALRGLPPAGPLYDAVLHAHARSRRRRHGAAPAREHGGGGEQPQRRKDGSMQEAR